MNVPTNTPALIECAPNFSEGADRKTLRALAAAIRGVHGVALLHTEANPSANRSVFTFAGAPGAVVEAAFQAARVAAERIDMRRQHGAHPRIGALDVCPLVPLEGIDLAGVSGYARKLGARIGSELDIPVYLYEASATSSERKNLAYIRKGEYEGLAEKMRLPEWKPDFGPGAVNERSGACAVGARPLLIAFNISLRTQRVEVARSIAALIRESGYMKTNSQDRRVRVPGIFKGLKAIGWYMDVYGCAQVSMNITDIEAAPLHLVYEAVSDIAAGMGTFILESELIGLIPKEVMIKAGNYFFGDFDNLNLHHTSDRSLISHAGSRLGLRGFQPFSGQRKRILEYAIQENREKGLLPFPQHTK